MRFDTEQALFEHSLEHDAARLAPVLEAVETYERWRRVRLAVTVVATVAGVSVLLLALWSGHREMVWTRTTVLAGCLITLFAWTVVREQKARRVLREKIAEEETR